MENVTKALLIAAGMFLAILILSSLVVFYNQISDFYAQEHEMAVTEQTQEFNSRFANYHGREIRGNELISVINRIVDYNNLYADLQGYKRVEITIDLKGHASELAYDSNVTLFENKIIQNKSNDDDIKDIANLSAKLTSDFGITDTKLQKLSSEIGNIVDASSKEYRNQKLKQILGYVPNESEIEKIVEATKQYYQYTQFKRVMFKCTEVTYDLDTKRVHTMKFEALQNTDGTLVLE